MRIVTHSLLTLFAALALSACQSDDPQVAEEGSGTETIAKLINSEDDLSIFADAMNNAGLADVLDGVASYTVLAPADEAFDLLGENESLLLIDEQRPALVAVLRNHIVPGYLTLEDIGSAIDLDDDGLVEMQTMGSESVAFSRDGPAIKITSSNGAIAHINGSSVVEGSNGVALQIDSLLATFD